MENDALSRSAVLEFLTNNIIIREDEITIMEEVCHTVKTFPALDVVPVVHAEWKDQDYTFTRFQCTACKSMNHSIMTKYCPDCGARMDGGTGAD